MPTRASGKPGIRTKKDTRIFFPKRFTRLALQNGPSDAENPA
jgi:hypothetical protein